MTIIEKLVLLFAAWLGTVLSSTPWMSRSCAAGTLSSAPSVLRDRLSSLRHSIPHPEKFREKPLSPLQEQFLKQVEKDDERDDRMWEELFDRFIADTERQIEYMRKEGFDEKYIQREIKVLERLKKTRKEIPEKRKQRIRELREAMSRGVVGLQEYIKDLEKQLQDRRKRYENLGP